MANLFDGDSAADGELAKPSDVLPPASQRSLPAEPLVVDPELQRLLVALKQPQPSSEDLAATIAKLLSQQERLERIEADFAVARKAIERQEDVMRGLSTPIIQVWDGVLAIPVIGNLNSERAEQLMQRLLDEIGNTHSRFALLDLTSVEIIDTYTADHLVKIVHAVELLGARAIITGIRSAVAQTMVSIGVDLSQILTLRNLQQGLKTCMRWMQKGEQS
jgi:rsbT co-antagonist protein RsbR